MDTPGLVTFLIGVVSFTLITMYTDIRTRRIPNNITLPYFVAGLFYQILFHGLSGLGDGLLGFLVGFGSLFVLWIIGGGGGGDVKLMGALAVWLGFDLTLLVLIASTLLVLVCTVAAIGWSFFRRGSKKTKDKYLATGKTTSKRRRGSETTAEKAQRRIMAYAVPIAVSTWAVLVWKYPFA